MLLIWILRPSWLCPYWYLQNGKLFPWKCHLSFLTVHVPLTFPQKGQISRLYTPSLTERSLGWGGHPSMHWGLAQSSSSLQKGHQSYSRTSCSFQHPLSGLYPSHVSPSPFNAQLLLTHRLSPSKIALALSSPLVHDYPRASSTISIVCVSQLNMHSTWQHLIPGIGS